ncbi:hypothetical protein SUGI_0424450 [Cryptomeria japonica]|nr:hypothetical protein SUGI_0424450 [Cryptomeria japonica]
MIIIFEPKTASFQHSQSVWRGHYAVACIAEKFRTDWDAYVAWFDGVPLSAEIDIERYSKAFPFLHVSALKLCYQYKEQMMINKWSNAWEYFCKASAVPVSS